MADLHVEHIIKKVLGADAAFIALVGTALSPMHTIQGQSFPFTIYDRDTTDITNDMSGASGMHKVSVSLYHYSQSPLVTLDIADRAPLELGSYTGPVTVGADSVAVALSLMTDQSMEYQAPTDGGERGVYVSRQRFDIAYTVST